MQTSLAKFAPSSSGRQAANSHTSSTQSQRRYTVVVRASDKLCKDMVSAPRAPTGPIEGTSKLVFVGAQGHQVEVDAPKDTYILDSGLDAGLELPFTCRGGICGACVGRVTEGQIDQSDVADLSFTISEEEEAQGMTLLCMARPLTDRVVIETQSDWGYSLGVAEWQGATGVIGGKKVEPLMGKKWDEIKKEA